MRKPDGSVRPVRIAVVMPAGPHDDIADTLASVVQYTDPSRIIVVIDDTGTFAATTARARDLSGDIAVIAAPPGAPGGYGGLWVKLAAGYTWVLDRFRPQIILRMDADALMLGGGIETAAEQAFARDRSIGMLGSYRIDPGRGTPGLLASRPDPARRGGPARTGSPAMPVTRPALRPAGPAQRLCPRRARARRSVHSPFPGREPSSPGGLVPRAAARAGQPGRRPPDGLADHRGGFPDR